MNPANSSERTLRSSSPRRDDQTVTRSLGAAASISARSRSSGGRSAALAGEHRVELLDVRLAHAGEPVEPFGAPRRDCGEARDGGEALVAEGGAGEDVRAAARDAPRGVALEPERVCDRVDVGGAVRDRAAGTRVESP